ncbi:ABC transporter substrate-binding protein [Saccharopolyspora sp. NPDC000995]
MTRHIHRRAFLRSSLYAAGLAAFTACGSTPATARRGGTLRAAFTGGGASETLNFLTGPTALDSVRARAMHGKLGTLNPATPDGVRYGVLEGIDVSSDLRTYLLRLRKGVTFTDGSALTARDVLYSLNAPVLLGALPYLKPPAQNFDLGAARIVDDLTLVLPAKQPIADGRLVLCQSTLVVKDATMAFVPAMPTCGPFRITEFVPGQGSTLVRHEGFYGLALGGGPYLDSLELRSIPDSNARVNALIGGQLDFVGDIGPVKARTLEANKRFGVSSGQLPHATSFGFMMNLAHKPFGDVRVRQAFKLAADREGMVRSVLFGRGFVGNDLPSLGFADYAAEIAQRPHDVQRARALLREAGAEGMPITLTTGSDVAGLVEVSTLYVENLKEIGVQATLDQRPPGQLFADINSYYQLPFTATYSPPSPPLSGYANTRTAGALSTFGFNRPDIDALVLRARSATDPAQRREAAVQAQRLMFEEGNSVLPVFAPTINGQAANVQGVTNEPWADFSGAFLA